MCCIVGSIGFISPKEYVFKGLKMLDYRGYDSAGVAYFNNGIQIYKDVGSVEHLLSIVPEVVDTSIMIGHTRWATHGAPTKLNTHPHISYHKCICLVHNGVIDNYKENGFILDINKQVVSINGEYSIVITNKAGIGIVIRKVALNDMKVK
jgi:glucosamine 6-phosphate synthetase-like amidotransferase/phosphosugar isomerase protein